LTTYVVLLLLALLWAAVLVPPWIKSRGGRRQGPRDPYLVLSSTLPPLGERGSVSGQVVPLRSPSQGTTEAGGQPAQYFGPASSAEQARMRRRNILVGLAGAALGTLILAVVMGGLFIFLNLLVDVALLGYVILLVRFQQASQDRMNKVRPIRPAQPARSAQPQNFNYAQRSAN
jgi:hypothetical protein